MLFLRMEKRDRQPVYRLFRNSVWDYLLLEILVDIGFVAGVYSSSGTDRHASLVEIATAANDPARFPEGDAPGLSGEAVHGTAVYTFPNGCHACEVEVDPESGRVIVERYVAIDDFGAVVNPLLLAGQVHGGIAQGIGQALHESCVYGEDGQLLSGSLMDYCLPRADDLPMFENLCVHDLIVASH